MVKQPSKYSQLNLGAANVSFTFVQHFLLMSFIISIFDDYFYVVANIRRLSPNMVSRHICYCDWIIWATLKPWAVGDVLLKYFVVTH